MIAFQVESITKIRVLSKYDKLAASVRQRFLLYEPLLREHGIELTIEPLISDESLRKRMSGGRLGYSHLLGSYASRLRTILRQSGCDLAIVQYELFPYLPALVDSLLLGRIRPYVFDFDDAIFHQYDNSSNPVVRFFLRNKIAKVIQQATLVFAGSDYLAEYARQFNDRVEQVPTVVDVAKYPLKQHCVAEDSLLKIGWIGSPSTSSYLEDILPSLERFAAAHPTRVIAIGSKPIDSPIVEVRSWSEATEINDLLECELGIMPVPDVPWARGKCAFKLIQYMACGLPVIASPVGANRTVVSDSVGFLADTEEQWVDALSRLASDANLRTTLGRNGRQLVEQEYSLQAVGPKVVGLLSDLLHETSDSNPVGRANH